MWDLVDQLEGALREGSAMYLEQLALVLQVLDWCLEVGCDQIYSQGFQWMVPAQGGRVGLSASVELVGKACIFQKSSGAESNPPGSNTDDILVKLPNLYNYVGFVPF